MENNPKRIQKIGLEQDTDLDLAKRQSVTCIVLCWVNCICRFQFIAVGQWLLFTDI